MTDELPVQRNCDVCGAEPMVGVAAVPGVPLSLAYGRSCLQHGAIPPGVAAIQIAQVIDPRQPSFQAMAPWAREQTVYIDGGYRRVDELTLEVRACERCAADEEPCPLCHVVSPELERALTAL